MRSIRCATPTWRWCASVDSVDWAMPLYSGIQRVRLENGAFKIIQLIGIDPTTFAGAPVKMKEGHIEDLRIPNTVVIDDLAVQRLAKNPGDQSHLDQAGRCL